MNIFEIYKKFADLGMTPANASDFVKGFQDWMIWREVRIPTPCPIVYRLEDGTLIALPFLDVKAEKSQIIGLSIDDVCFLLWEFPMGNIPKKHIDKALHNFALEKFEQEAEDCRLSLPSVDQLKCRKEKSEDFDLTIKILQENGVEANEWRPTNYWTSDNQFVKDNEGFQINDVFPNARRHCCLRPIIKFSVNDIVGRFDEYGMLNQIGKVAFWKLKRQ